MKKKRLLSGLLIGLMAFSLVGCGVSGDDISQIVIGSANPMTGDSAQFGDMKVKAIQLAIDEVNEKGGIDGKKVKLEIGDDTGNPKEAPNVAQKFASNDELLAVIGHWNSSCTLAARGIYDSSGIPVITDSVNKAVTDGTTPYVFRVSLTDTDQANKLAEYAYKKLGKKNAAILFTANDFGTGLKNDFTKKFESLGGNIVGTETYFEGQSKDFSPQLTKIKGKNPDLLFIAGYYVETALIAQQSKELGLDVDMLGTEGISSEELVKLGGDAVEGIKFTGFFHPEVEFPGTKEFVKAFREKYNKDPDTYGALAYDSAKLILEGLKKNGVSRDGIKKYLEEVKDFPGVAGPVSFKNNAASRNIIILTVKDGKIVPADIQPDK
ncbi:ABC transporter branched-chain amino acid-binding protein LivK [Gottschalkia purinilytica]|uniref:ABC transporter branched-chain amino acid-binding protein LivK n=1 Tax=Gottschalkia purinilytica TaxID=1503 RepID=A0A0L0W7G1_GOTPU|nr:ABC transporter substrate-binding protein [Gottschalkia purinilytica]KNF07473.1 ABC transporter branched-chain amino acid-binding protein LivK [Gottschalkia purinilytica]